MRLHLLLLVLSFIIPFNSCTTTKTMSDNQTKRGHFRLYSYPEAPSSKKPAANTSKIVIVASNNFEGKVWPEHFNIPNKFKERRVISTGGIEAMKAYSDIFKKKFENQVLFVDSGSFYHPERNYIQTAFLYNYLAPDVLALGTNEFSFSPRTRRYTNKLESITSKLNPVIITSNLFDLTTAKKAKLRNIKETVIKEINGVKVGFLSTLSQKLSTIIPAKNFLGLYIQNPASTIITNSDQLRRSGAQIIVLLTNSSIDCNSMSSKNENLPEDKVNFDPVQDGYCMNGMSELFNIISQLPPHTIDLIVTSDGVGKTANFIKDIPVIQNAGKGQYYSWVELSYNNKLATVETDKTKIHQPVKLCHQFLKSHEDCYLEESLSDQEIIPARFLGEEIKITPLPTI